MPARSHGMTETKNYSVWSNMRRRCGFGPSHGVMAKTRKRYSGRGISVCERWQSSFPNFLEDMGEKPHGLTLDRIDNDKGYSKDNCRWATYLEQGNNCRSNVKVEFMGERKGVMEWSRELGVPGSSIAKRVKRGRTHAESVAEVFFLVNMGMFGIYKKNPARRK